MERCKGCSNKGDFQHDVTGRSWCPTCLPKLQLMNYGKLNNFPQISIHGIEIWLGEGAWAVTVGRMPMISVHTVLNYLNPAQSPSERQEPSLIDKEASLEVPTLESHQKAIIEVSDVCCQCGAVATKHSPSLDEEGKPKWWYCEEHAHCNRCGRWEWKFNEALGVNLCVCFSEAFYALGQHLKPLKAYAKVSDWAEVRVQALPQEKEKAIEVKQDGPSLFDPSPSVTQEDTQDKEWCACGKEATEYLGDGTPVCEKCLEKEEIA